LPVEVAYFWLAQGDVERYYRLLYEIPQQVVREFLWMASIAPEGT